MKNLVCSSRPLSKQIELGGRQVNPILAPLPTNASERVHSIENQYGIFSSYKVFRTQTMMPYCVKMERNFGGVGVPTSRLSINV